MGGVDTTIFAAFAAGFVSFISPCVLPLVPGYLSAVSGVSVADMEERRAGTSEVLLPAVIFCLAFTAVFVALLVRLWRGKDDALPWAVAALVAVTAERTLPGTWHVLLGGLAGSLIAVLPPSEAITDDG